ncbi:hypothetical protein ACP4OV_010497 [Aristida adscensionis]
MLCPKICTHHGIASDQLVVGKGVIHPYEIPKVSQAKGDLECETDQEFEAVKVTDKVYRKPTEEELNLEPLCDENKISIAFTYIHNGVLVGCKYGEVSKKFSQEANLEKILYGPDDIKCAQDVIIVEGEIDKLSIEEAGHVTMIISLPELLLHASP